MSGPNDFASLAAAIGDRTRGAVLASLIDGRARTATELAVDGDVAPSTMSSHLARLADAGPLAVVRQGRYRYYRLASPEVAGLVESLMAMAAPRGKRSTRADPEDAALRRARVCYDHLAGAVGAAMLNRLLALRSVLRAPAGRAVEVTAQGESFLHTLAVRG